MENKQKAILAFMSAGKEGERFGSVQLQKIPFLIQREAGKETGIADMFDFKPYNFGPHDASIYRVIDDCCAGGMVRDIPPNEEKKFKLYELTELGRECGLEALNALPGNVQKYIKELVEWVMDQSFSDLLRSVYAAYPDMQKNSIFLYPSEQTDQT